MNFVNVGPTAKIAALKSHTVDIISDFYNEHDLKVIEFGADLGYVNWKDIGLNPYGNSLIVNGAYLAKNPKLVEEFVKISQKAYAACVADVAPCLKALLDQASGLDKENQQRQWERIKFLMTDEFTTTKALGWIDAERMKKDYELVQTYLGMEKPFDVDTRVFDQDAGYVDQDGCQQGEEVSAGHSGLVRHARPQMRNRASGISRFRAAPLLTRSVDASTSPRQ